MSDFDTSVLTEVQSPEPDDVIAFELQGYTIGWRADGLALRRAADRGVEVGEILQQLDSLFSVDIDPEELEDLSEEEIEDLVEERMETDSSVSGFVSTVVTLIWLGTLRFEPDAKQEAIASLIDLKEIENVPIDEMLAKIFPKIEDELDGAGSEEGNAEEKGGAEGKE
jgi:hypothetical protein